MPFPRQLVAIAHAGKTLVVCLMDMARPKEETEEERDARLFRTHFNREPFLKKGETPDLSRIKEVLSGHMADFIGALRRYEDCEENPPAVTESRRKKLIEDARNDADLRFEMLATLCRVANRFNPSVPATPVGACVLYRENSVQRGYATPLDEWRKKMEERALMAQKK